MTFQLMTDRLTIRPFKLDDIKPFYDLCNNKEVMRYIGDGHIPSIEEMTQSITTWMQCFQQKHYSLFALNLNSTHNLIGFCGLIDQVIDNKNEVELGYRLGQNFWHQGLAAEAALAVKKYAFTQLQLPHLYSIIKPENLASIKVATKIGMQFSRETVFHGHQVHLYHISNS